MMPPGTRDPDRDEQPGAMPPEIVAEASVWIARLHGPDRSPTMERECLAWQARSALHRLAFERCTEVWEAVPRLTLSDAYASAAPRQDALDRAGPGAAGGRARWVVAALVVFAGVAGLGLRMWERAAGDTYVTQVGEQRSVLLADGSRLSLNTDTGVRVDMGRAKRSVTLLNGEALFEVAKDPERPFVVRAADSEVVALGTVFSVRLAGGSQPAEGGLDVALVEGRVSVRPATSDLGQGVTPAKELVMQAGERMRLSKARGAAREAVLAKVDRPRLEQLVAWQRNEVIFDDVALPEAVAEMNRYNRTPVVLSGDAAWSQLRVSGLYRAGDSAGFARAVAALHGLVARERAGRLELERPQ